MEVLQAIVDHEINHQRFDSIEECIYFKEEGLGIYHMNIRSLEANFGEFLYLIDGVKNKINILVLTETAFDPKKRDFCYDINGFKSYYSENTLNKNGGVVVYVSNNITVFETKELQNINTCDHIKIYCSIQNIKYEFLCIYRSPSIRNIDDFLNSLELLLNKKDNNTVSCLLGDVNIDLLNTTCRNVNSYLNILSQHNYISYINTPTRTQHDTQTCLDHFFCSGIDTSQILSCVIETSQTDHFSQYILIKNKLNNTRVNEEFSIETIDYDGLNNSLENYNWDILINCLNVNDATNSFIEILTNETEKFKSIKKITKKFKPLKPWISIGLVKCIRKREKLKQQFKKHPNNESLKKYYFNYKENLTNIIKNTKNEHFKKKIENEQDNPKTLWNILHEFKYNKKKKNSQIQVINDPNNNGISIDCINDNIYAANIFNDHFRSVGSSLNKLNTQKNVQNENDISISPDVQLNDFEPTDENEVMNYIKNMRGRSSPGPDQIHVKTLKQIAHNIIKPLVHIINLSFSEGVFPNVLKESIIIPIYKQGNTADVNNYRPISLTSNIAKLFEKCCKKRLESFLDNNNLILDNQYGFRKNLGTDDAILDLTSFVYDNLNKSQKVLVVSLDISKAFDCVNKNTLQLQLKKHGISGKALDWFKTYLDNRRQRVKLNDGISDSILSICGVPQGTVCSPKLYSIYTNNITRISKSKVFTFADDTLLVYTGNNWNDIHEEANLDLNNVYNWFKTLDLHINPSKTSYITVSLTKTGQPINSNLKIHTCNTQSSNCTCTRLNHVTSFKYLGLIIDNNFSWKQHISLLINKIRRLFYVFLQLRNILSIKNLKLIYYALAQSIIQYGIIGWGSACKSILEPLQRTQNILLRIILKKHRRYKTNKLYTEFNTFNITQLYFYKILYFINKKNISNTIDRTNHKHNTRQNNSAVLYPMKKNIVKRHFIYLTPKILNTVPSNLTEIPSPFLKKFLKIATVQYINQSEEFNKVLSFLN